MKHLFSSLLLLFTLQAECINFQTMDTKINTQGSDWAHGVSPVPWGHGRLRILSQNVGGADFLLKWPPVIEPPCPLFKLCDSKIINRVRNEISNLKPDIIFFQEVLNLHQLKEGDQSNPPILTSEYQAICSPGAGGLYEVCIAWNIQKAGAVKDCKAVVGVDGGGLACVLKVGSTLIQMVNTHPSAWNSEDRNLVLKALWAKLIDRTLPTIVAGDFNTENGTFGFDESIPYPSEFETVFGRHKKSYGRTPSADNFFGFMRENKKSGWDLNSVHSTIFWESIDHIFINFGIRPTAVSRSEMPCENWVCLGNQDHFEWGPADWSFGPSFGPKVDHLPILALISW